MKITVKHENTTVTVDESDNNHKDNKTAIKWKDQRSGTLDLLKAIFYEIKLLKGKQ